MTDHIDTPDGQQPGDPFSRVAHPSVASKSETLQKLIAPARTQMLGDLASTVDKWLTERGEDLHRAVTGGWSETHTWIKATLGGVALLGVSAVGGTLLSLALQGVAGAAHAVADVVPGGSARRTGLLASITSPVWSYLRSHTQGLAIDARTAYGAWMIAVLGTGVLSFATKSFGARLAWGITGAGTGWMVWHGAPAAGREVAVGITALAWALLSIAALRGFRIGFRAVNNNHFAPEIRPQVNVPEPVVKRVEINGRALNSLD